MVNQPSSSSSSPIKRKPVPYNTWSEMIGLEPSQSTSTAQSSSINKSVSGLSEPTWSETLRAKPKSTWTPEEYDKLAKLSKETVNWFEENRTLSLYSAEEANDSTDTITPSNAWTEVKGNTFKENIFDTIPTDVTASEFTPLTRPEGSSSSEGSISPIEEEITAHTYPPRPLGKRIVLNYYPDSIDPSDPQPFARGFQENIDPELNIQRGSVVLSANFLDKKDN